MLKRNASRVWGNNLRPGYYIRCNAAKEASLNQERKNMKSNSQIRQTTNEVIFLLDQSGSMEDICNKTIESYNNFISSLKMCGTKVYFTLMLFSTNCSILYDKANLNQDHILTKENYSPQGGTAYYDAVCKTIKAVESRTISEPDTRDGNSQITYVILTDGVDNASQEYGSDDLKRFIEVLYCSDSRNIIFLGSNENIINEAEEIGIRKVMSFDASNTGIMEAMKRISTEVKSILFLSAP